MKIDAPTPKSIPLFPHRRFIELKHRLCRIFGHCRVIEVIGLKHYCLFCNRLFDAEKGKSSEVKIDLPTYVREYHMLSSHPDLHGRGELGIISERDIIRDGNQYKRGEFNG